jgi:hypothetical protein
MRAPFSFWKASGGVAAPTLASANYATGDILGGGQSIVLTGTNMAAVTSVTCLGASVAPSGTAATTVTFTLPAHAAGTGTISVTSPAGTSGTIAFEYFNPTSIFDLYLDGTQYAIPAGTGTWTARKGGNATEATTPPAIGSGARQLGGRNTVDFNGTTHRLVTAANLDTWTTLGQGIVIALFNADAAAADAAAGSPYLNPAIACTQAAGYFGMGYSAAGLRSALHDGTYKEAPGIAAGTAAWHLGKTYWDGATLKQDVDSGAATSVATAGPLNLAFLLQIGEQNAATAAFFGGRLAVLAAAKVIPGAGSLLKFRAVMNQQWGTSL